MLYDYKCNNCEKEKEVEMRITEEKIVYCDCGDVMRRVINKPVHIIKAGHCWERDNYT